MKLFFKRNAKSMKKSTREWREAVEAIRNHRKTLSYNDEVMMCHFIMKKGASIPLHGHRASQNGYVISGKVKFFTETGEFIAEKGLSYVFDANEKHGAEILEDSEVVEAFAPSRPEYEPKAWYVPFFFLYQTQRSYFKCHDFPSVCLTNAESNTLFYKTNKY